MSYCYDCMCKLNFTSPHKINYKYCKKCWNKNMKLYNNHICQCKLGFLKPCYFSNRCNKIAKNCNFCTNNWINEYCDECR